MKVKSIYQIALLILVYFFATMCKNVDDEIATLKMYPVDSTYNVVLFKDEILPIFDQNCNEHCHALSHSYYRVNPILSASVAYNELISGGYLNLEFPEQSLLYLRVSGTSLGNIMPPNGKLPDQKIQRILDWIRSGAPDN